MWVFRLSHDSEISATDGYVSFPSVIAVNSMNSTNAAEAPASHILPFFPIYGHNKLSMSDIQSVENKRQAAFWKVAGLCLVSAFLNSAVSYVINDVGKALLFLDTLFTAAMCFAFGLVPGLVTALLLPVFSVFKYMLMGLELANTWWTFLFVICVILEVLLIFSFMGKIKPLDDAFRKKPSFDTFIGLVPILLVLAVLDCMVVSMSGGIIDFFLTKFTVPKASYPEESIKLGLLRSNVPLMASAVLSRIPVNMIDRFFVVFGGWGVSILYRKVVKQVKSEE